MPSKCRREGCDNEPARYADGYYGDVCRNIAIKKAARDASDWEASDEEIERMVRENHERIMAKLEAADAE